MALAMFDRKERLCRADMSILQDLFQRCPGEVAIIQKYDPTFQAQLIVLAPDCQIPEACRSSDGIRQQAMIANEASEDLEWQLLALPGNIAPSHYASDKHEEAHRKLRQAVKQEFELYVSGWRHKMMDKVRIHNQLFRAYLQRFVEGQGVFQPELLNAWTRLLHVVVRDTLFFTKTKWWTFTRVSNSKFEDCLSNCLRHLGAFANDTADAPLELAELRCPYSRAGIKNLQKVYDDPEYESREAYCIGLFFASTLRRTWRITHYMEAYRSGLMDGRTLSENALEMAADAGAYAVVAPMSVALPFGGALAAKALADGLGKGAKQLLRRLPGFRRSTKTARLQQAFSLLGLGHWRVQESISEELVPILQEAVLHQLQHLHARGEDSLLVWMAYDYIRKYMKNEGVMTLPDFLSLEAEDLQSIGLEPDEKKASLLGQVDKINNIMEERSTETEVAQACRRLLAIHPEGKYQHGWFADFGIEKATGKKVCMKKCRGLAARHEVEAVMQCGSHRNILELLDVFRTDDDAHMLVFEHPTALGLDSLVELCGAGGCLERRALPWMRELLTGVEHLHSRTPAPVVHRCLCLDTAVVCRGPEDGDAPLDWKRVKLVDFGKARALPDGQRLITVCGHPDFRAPEMKSPYDSAVDMWAVGVIFYHILYAGSRSSGAAPPEMTLRSTRMPESKALAEDLLNRMLCPIPRGGRARIRAEDALRHPWITEGYPTDGTWFAG
mmetsp:Transcript_13188/g.24357  ORF Transcript_13188/g.24357 Transcript_13188/m.24357 type:complete len:726 (-) Transcript_13188:66-2243(-)